jgi:hypothetical protein
MLRSDVTNRDLGWPMILPALPRDKHGGAPTQPTVQQRAQHPVSLAHNNNVGAFAKLHNHSDYLVDSSPAVGMNTARRELDRTLRAQRAIWNDVNLDMVNGRDYMIV